MLRITAHTKSAGTIELKLAGRLGRDEVELLTCELHRLGKAATVILNLAEIEFIDAIAFSLFERWSGTPLLLQGGSVFIQKQLKERGLQGDDLT